jgi:hypothetical integral membrane protein (TIGR02206 family)
MNMFSPGFTGRFRLFSPSHVTVMLVIACAWIAVPLLFRGRKNTRADTVFRRSLASLLGAQYLGWMLWEAVTGRFTVQLSLPLNLCDLSNFLCAYILLFPSHGLFEILYFWALAGTIQSYITPNIFFSFPHFEFFAFYIQHGGEILTILYLIAVFEMRPRKISMLKSLGALTIYIAIVYVFNLATGSNYMFLMADTPHPSTATKMIALFGPPPRHIIGLGIVSIMSVVLLYAPFAVKDRFFAGKRPRAS